MRAASHLVTGLLLALGTAPLSGQSGWGADGGTLSPEVRYSLIHSDEGSGVRERSRIDAILLWREPPSAPSSTSPSEHEAAQRRYREARRGAEDRGRTFLGSLTNRVVRMAEYDPERRQVFVLGREFALADATKDSALVILIDMTEPGEATVAGTAWVGRDLPSDAWGRSWSSGDTTFIVRSRQREAHLLALLRRSAEVRAFLP